MATTVHVLLAQIRATAANNRDLGTAFERLMVACLKTDPQWTAQFSDVWTLAEAPLPPGIDRRDLGIDLVAADVGTGGLYAFQCKFFESDHTVSKAEIDSFFAASGKGGFTRRLIISTTDKWGPNAEAMLDRQQIHVSRIGMADLESSPVDTSENPAEVPDHLSKLAHRRDKIIHEGGLTLQQKPQKTQAQ